MQALGPLAGAGLRSGGEGVWVEMMQPPGTAQGILRRGSLEMVPSTVTFDDRDAETPHGKVICAANGQMGPHTPDLVLGPDSAFSWSLFPGKKSSVNLPLLDAEELGSLHLEIDFQSS